MLIGEVWTGFLQAFDPAPSSSDFAVTLHSLRGSDYGHLGLTLGHPSLQLLPLLALDRLARWGQKTSGRGHIVFRYILHHRYDLQSKSPAS